MTHEDAGKYKAKHPPGTAVDAGIAGAIREKAAGGALFCAAAERISRDLGVEMKAVGVAADLLEIKIKNCQLGLFGWGEKPDHGKRIEAAGAVSEALQSAVEKAAADGKVACAALWAIAARLDIQRTEASAACEALGLKVRNCQLGAF